MITILHLSDLHLLVNQIDESLKKLKKLIVCVKQCDNARTNVCVVTGDIIDARPEIDDEGNEIILSKKWENAVNFFNVLLDANIFEKILFVPGNHDVSSMNFEFMSNYNNISKCNIIEKNMDFPNEYYINFNENFEKTFIKRLQDHQNVKKNNIEIIYTKDTHHGFTKVGSIGFYLINSVFNYNRDDVKHLCINCSNLANLMDIHKEASDIRVAVSHNPLTDVCENVTKNNYGVKQALNINQLLLDENSFFQFNLSGHYHADKIFQDREKLKVVDSRFTLESTECKFYMLDTQCGVRCAERKILYRKKLKKFIIEVEKEELIDVLNLSKSQLNSELFGHDIKLNDISTSSNLEINNGNFVINDNVFDISKLSELFYNIITYKQVKEDKKNITLDNKDNIFKKILDDSNRYYNEKKDNSINKPIVPLTIKGELGTGKTTFLNLIYWYILLSDYSLNFIPIYINLRNFIELDTIKNNEKISKFIINANELGKKYNKKIIYLIDGFDNVIVNENLDSLINNFNNILIDSSKNGFCIYSVNRHSQSLLDPNNKDNKLTRNKNGYLRSFKDSKYILYFYRLSFAEDKSEISNVIKNYLSLVSMDAVGMHSKFIDLLIKNGFSVFDCQLMHSYAKNFVLLGNDITNFSDDLIIEKLIDNQSLNNIAKEYLEGKNLSNEDYKKLTSQTEIEYAYAKGYLLFLSCADNLMGYLLSGQANYQIKKNKMMYSPRYFNKQINHFVGLILKRSDYSSLAYELSNSLKKSKIISKSYVGFNKISLAQFLYVLRNTKFNENAEKDFVVKLQGQLVNVKSHNDDFELIVRRTLKITELFQHKFETVYEYLNDLLKNKDLRKLNRQFDMYYYGDREYLDDNEKTEAHVYHTVYQHLHRFKNIDWSKIKSFELQLFTLCNIVQKAIYFRKFKKYLYKSNNKSKIDSLPSVKTLKSYCEKVNNLLDRYFLQVNIQTPSHLKLFCYYKHVNDFCKRYLNDQTTLIDLVNNGELFLEINEYNNKDILVDYVNSNDKIGKFKKYRYQTLKQNVAKRIFLLDLSDEERSVVLTLNNFMDIVGYLDYCFLNTYDMLLINGCMKESPNYTSHIPYLAKDIKVFEDYLDVYLLVNILRGIEIADYIKEKNFKLLPEKKEEFINNLNLAAKHPDYKANGRFSALYEEFSKLLN